MAAKLTFNDIENAELDVSKLNFDAGFSGSLSSGVVNPSADNPVGSLYINTASGSLFRKTASGGSNWVQISSVTSTVFTNRYRASVQNGAVTATSGGDIASFGDLVGYCGGAAAYTQIAVLNVQRALLMGTGAASASFVAGGATILASGNPITFSAGTMSSTELFNGTVWTASGNLSAARAYGGAAGSLNANFIVGGSTGSETASSLNELGNGSVWSSGTRILTTRAYAPAAGTQMAGLIMGGATGLSGGANYLLSAVSESFNGSAWAVSNTLLRGGKNYASGGGNAFSAVINGGSDTNQLSINDIFNGSAWATSGDMLSTRFGHSFIGSQQAGVVMGLANTLTITEIFNGSSWAVGPGLAARSGGGSTAFGAGIGSSNDVLYAGGFSSSSTSPTRGVQRGTQTVFKKLNLKNLPEAKNIGILSSTSSVVLQGTITSTVYPANKYLVVSRFQNSTVSTNLNLISIGSIQGVAPTMTYNLSTTANLTCVVPGNIVIIQGAGGTPISGANIGTFLISRVISPSSFEISNASGIAQNPGTGFASILSSMLAVDYISPQDIVVGKTDSNGLLTIAKPLTVGSIFRRLK